MRCPGANLSLTLKIMIKKPPSYQQKWFRYSVATLTCWVLDGKSCHQDRNAPWYTSLLPFCMRQVAAFLGRWMPVHYLKWVSQSKNPRRFKSAVSQGTALLMRFFKKNALFQKALTTVRLISGRTKPPVDIWNATLKSTSTLSIRALVLNITLYFSH